MADTDPGANGAAPITAPGDRGRLEIHDRVVEKIAMRAAAEVTGVRARAGGMFGLRRGSPNVTAEVRRGAVRVAMACEVRWPAPAATAAADVRSAVTDRLVASTGLRVRRVDVTVTPVRSGDREGERGRVR